MGGWEEYKPTVLDFPGREMVMPGCDYKVERRKIPEYLARDEIEMIRFFWQWKSLGWPFSGGWAEQPANLVDVVFLLEGEYTKWMTANGRHG